MYGAKWLQAICMGLVAFLTLLIPISCKAAEPDEFPWLLVTVRALMGICEVSIIIFWNNIDNNRVIIHKFNSNITSIDCFIVKVTFLGCYVSLYACHVGKMGSAK